METVALCVGYLAIAALCCLAFVAAAAILSEALARYNDRVVTGRIDQYMRELGNRLMSGSHWFGESPDAAQLLRCLGETFRDGYGFSESDIRDKWRRAIAARPTVKGQE